MFADTFYTWLLPVIIGTVILSATTETFHNQPTAHVIGFGIFLLLFARAVNLARTFRRIPGDLLLVLGYAITLTVFFYIVYPYAEYRETISPYFRHGVTAYISGAAYAPSLTLKALKFGFEFKIPEGLGTPAAHYPFALGFYIGYSLLLIAAKVYEPLGSRHPAPTLFLMTLYNFILSVIFFAVAGTGAALGYTGLLMAALSFSVWGYWYFPRFGIPTVWRSRSRRRDIEGIGADIERAQKKLEKYFNDIDKI